jgi:hypothetical protein
MNDPSSNALTGTLVIVNLGAGVYPLTEIFPLSSSDRTRYRHSATVSHDVVSLPSPNNGLQRRSR